MGQKHPRTIRSIERTAGAVALLVCLTSSAAWSQPSPYCRKVRARAAADAALLMAPTAQAQAIRFPKNATTDSGVTTGTGLQFRAALAWSPLDFYKALRVQRVGDADCEQHEAMAGAVDLLSEQGDYGRLPAFQSERRFIDAEQTVWQDVEAKTDRRLAANVATIATASQIRSKTTELGRKRLRVYGEIERLEARGADNYRGALSTLIASVEASAMHFEREASHVRSLDPWSVSATGGVIPQYTPVDYFGIIQVGYNFGGFARNAQESRYIDARADELRHSRYELGDQLRRFQAQVKSAEHEAKEELAIVERATSWLVTTRATFESSTAPDGLNALALAELEWIDVEADRVFLTAWIAELDRVGGDGHDQ